LNAPGTASGTRPGSEATRSIIDEETGVLPIAGLAGQPGRAPPYRYEIATAR
jgi:hypothetical protein